MGLLPSINFRVYYLISLLVSLQCKSGQVLQLLRDLRINHPKSAMLLFDNQATLHIVANPISMSGQNT